MKIIPLTKGAVARVSDADYIYLMSISRKWSLNSKGYAVKYTTDKQTGKRTVLYMHRVVAERMFGPLGRFQVDHINRDRLNNTRDNLRLATRSQNQANQGRKTSNSTGIRGVTWRAGRYEARIRYKGHRLALGRYRSPELAAHAYAYAARALYHEFAGDDLPTDPCPDLIRDSVRARLRDYGISLRA